MAGVVCGVYPEPEEAEMNDTEPTPWQMVRDADATARTLAQEWLDEHPGEDPDDADIWDYAHEHADGSEYVIYTYKARTIWMESSDVQAYEDDADGLDVGASIDKRITVSVYLWLAARIVEHARELYAAQDNDDDEVAS